MADFYALREEELRLDDDLSPLICHFFFYFSLVFEKTRETACATVSAAIWPCPSLVQLPFRIARVSVQILPPSSDFVMSSIL